ncbi:early nodulin-like protein 1 [Camellia sinensis]|uniref:early nodulin-like protein 1 n=1 Tax=Camellia sinensis TaxID=4442 RepID=UPI001036A4FD|nr:early nodulin-like protein 1 [Camellia sinensis]
MAGFARAVSSSSSSLVVLLLVFLANSSLSEAREFLVGGKTNAWKTPSSEFESLNLWAQNSRFLIGDSLVWNYDGNKDSMVEVRKRDYITCNTSSPIIEHKDGNTNVKLDRSGPFYFINREEGHCDKGQKLIVVVMSAKLIWKLICVLFDIVSQINFKRFVGSSGRL